MITKSEIEEMLARMPESTEKMTQILKLALACEDSRCVCDNWEEIAAQHLRNEQFYRDLLHKCADLLGEECRVCDDGSVIPEGAFLALKVPEVLAKRLEALYPQSRQIELATTECCQMARRIAELEEILKATRLVAARNRDVRKRDVEELEKACLSKDKVIDDKNAHIRDLEAETARLHKLWSEAEHKLIATEDGLKKAYACLGQYRLQAMWEEPNPTVLKFDGGYYRTEKGVIYLPDLPEKKTVEQNLSEECSRLHKLWHEAEHKLTQIKALTEPSQDVNPPAL